MALPTHGIPWLHVSSRVLASTSRAHNREGVWFCEALFSLASPPQSAVSLHGFVFFKNPAVNQWRGVQQSVSYFTVSTASLSSSCPPQFLSLHPPLSSPICASADLRASQRGLFPPSATAVFLVVTFAMDPRVNAQYATSEPKSALPSQVMTWTSLAVTCSDWKTYGGTASSYCARNGKRRKTCHSFPWNPFFFP
jgi:hypothetical protein